MCHICGLELRLRVSISNKPTYCLYQYPESADNKPMSDTNTLRDSARPIRRAVILERLRARNREPVAAHVEDYNGEYSAEEEAKLALAEAAAAAVHIQVADAPPHDNLKKIVARLKDYCKEEQEKTATSLNAEPDISVVAAYRELAAMQPKEELGTDTSILGRVRRGEWPPDQKVEDLLAPLRLVSPALDSEESYEDMHNVLQAWNQHVVGDCQNNLEARQALVAALEKRTKAVDKVLAIVRDEKNINQFDRIGQEGILEPSKRRLLKAIHAYRPETRKFKSQDPFDLLAVMWANIGRANPNITGHDDGVYLMYKVLNRETELERRFEREEKRRGLQAKKQAAILKGDTKKADVCTTQWMVYNKNLASAARQQTIEKLKCARRNMRDIVLQEQLQLTMLRSAQQWKANDNHPDDFIPRWDERLDKYEEKTIDLDSKLERYFPDLESTAEVTAHQVQRTLIHDTVLTRAHKITGEDLVGLDEVAKKAVLEARLNDSLTPMMIMKLSRDGVRESQQVARQMRRHVGAMEESLSELFEAAKTKHEELETLSLFVDQDGNLSNTGDVKEDTEEVLRKKMAEWKMKQVALTELGGESLTGSCCYNWASRDIQQVVTYEGSLPGHNLPRGTPGLLITTSW
jgi:hypothetical protein